MKFKVGDKVRLKSGLIHRQMYGSLPYNHLFPQEEYTVKSCDSTDNTYLCTIPNKCEFWFSDEMLEPVYADGGYCTGFKGGKIPTPEKPVSIEEQIGLPKGVIIHNVNPVEWYKPCVDLAFNAEAAEKLAKQIKERLSGSEIGFKEYKEDKPMTYYVTDGKRIDKTCNKQIDTKTTHVSIHGGRYTGKATCDAENYDRRQGLLEAIANAVCNGNFDKYYNDDIKAHKRLEKALCRCSICGVTYDTASEARACEQAHKDRKQAKLEKYLISKEAKRRIAEAEREGKIEELMKDLLKKKAEK